MHGRRTRPVYRVTDDGMGVNTRLFRAAPRRNTAAGTGIRAFSQVRIGVACRRDRAWWRGSARR